MKGKKVQQLTLFGIMGVLLLMGCSTSGSIEALRTKGDHASPVDAIVDPATVTYPELSELPQATRDEHITRLMSQYRSGIIDFNTFGSSSELYAGLLSPDVRSAELYIRWNILEPVEGQYNWEIIDRAIEYWGSMGKTVEFRIPTSDNALNITPSWVFDDYFIRRVTVGQWFDFELPQGGFDLLSGATRTDDPERTLSSRWAITGSSERPSALFRLKKSRALTTGKTYSIALDYKAIEDGIYYIRLVDSQGANYLGQGSYWKGSAGTSASFSTTLNVPSDALVEIGIASEGGSISLDNISIQEYTHSFAPAAYPQIFDPRFKALYERFIRELAARYADDPTLAIVGVGPVGRWDEVMLDSSELTSSDDYSRQWNQYGYSDQKFLDHIGWAMDLYRYYFPNKLARINTAYGSPGLSDSTLIWRRTAELAFEKGVQIKQNGMQENYFGYPGPQPFPWAAEKVKSESWGNVTYETAGQIYRNDTGIGTPIGHPVTVFNNVIAQGADAMFLYPDDIKSVDVAQYHHYLQESLGSKVIGSYYTRFGSWPVYSELNSGPITWDTIWMRLKPTLSPESQYTLTVKEGESCAISDSFITSIVLDIPDRALYQSPSGLVLGIEYFDEGTDAFEVSLYDRQAESWKLAGRVAKQDSRSWQQRSFVLPSGLIDIDEHGSDEQYGEIRIDSLGDGPEYIRLVNLNVVALNEFETRVLVSNEPTATTIALDEPVTMSFESSEPVNRIRIPVSSESHYERNLLEATLFGVRTDGSSEKLVTKQYDYFSSGDIWEIQVRGGHVYESYELKVTSLLGTNALFATQQGSPAYEISTFTLVQSEKQPESFMAARPFAALMVEKVDDNQLIKVSRRDTDGHYQLVQETEVHGSMAYLEPLSAGYYQISTDTGSIDSVSPGYLVSRFEPRSAIRLDSESVELDLLKGELQVDGASVNAKVVTLDGPGAAMTFEVPPFVAAESHVVELSMVNTSSSSLMRLFMAENGQEFSDEVSCIIPVVSDDAVLRDYRIGLDMTPFVGMEVSRIRLELAGGAIDAGRIEFDRLSLSRREYALHRDCDTPATALYGRGLDSENSLADGALILKEAFSSVDTGQNVSTFTASEDQVVRIELVNRTKTEDFDLYWSAVSFDENGRRAIQNGSLVIPMERDTDSLQILEIPVGKEPGWSGRITTVGLSFFNDYDQQIEIHDLAVKNTD